MVNSPVIFFDGVCNLCNSSVQFVITHDRENYFKFAALQSEFAKVQLPENLININEGASFILLENGKIYKKSTAALRVAKKLAGLWPLLYTLIIIPPFIRDAIYALIAKNRYKWFGKQESCWVPTPDLKSKFLA